MVTIKETKKKLTLKGRYFMLHYVRYLTVGESDEMIATLSFANLVCSVLCWSKDCNNGQESENEEILMSESRNHLLRSYWDLHVVRNHV